ncbi:Ldh family oxidoreductase [Paenibacillus xylaniclasticus]|uniref:Ldh family oxidoreductase n=1 Tax=Paenibacillus xylaniclasticus TaxID=588083 RepID=UPI000FD779CA|nr:MULTISPECIES: Ldh family oxidoreductase [Paenibacillus]GFN32276.1 malate dehydrogenase [Paenibacillus curdlanolyticus]
MSHEVRVERKELRRFIEHVFAACGVSEEHSRTAADVLCYADEAGFDTHGVANLERIYVTKLQGGRINPTAEFMIVSETPGIAVMDAGQGLGLVAGVHAMNLAIAKARQVGVGCVAVRNSSHFGGAGYYVKQALEAGMIGIAMSNLGAQTIARPLNGTVNMLGSNPISMSAPADSLPPFVLEMGTTVVATGKVLAAKRKGESIPEGWLVDDNGKPVTDPEAYYNGTGHIQMLGGSLETGGAKGYGLAVMVDILCGALSGAKMGPDPSLLDPNNANAGKVDDDVGHFFLALDVAAFRPLKEFQSSMDTMLQALLSCPTSSPEKKVVYAGYPEAMHQKNSNSIAIHQQLFESLEELASRLNIPSLAYSMSIS